MLLPANPTKRVSPTELDRRSKLGVSLEGVIFDPPAPVDAILAARTIAAFDDQGATATPHRATTTPTRGRRTGSIRVTGTHRSSATRSMALASTIVGGDEAEPGDLDVCRGHSDPERGYHYHSAAPGENLFIGCFMGEPGTAVQADQGQ